MKKAVAVLICVVLCLNIVCFAQVTDFSVDGHSLMLSGNSEADNYVGVRILSGNTVVYYTQTHSNSSGRFGFDLNLSRELADGEYNLEIIADDVNYSQDFNFPDNKVYLETEKIENGDTNVSDTKVLVSDAVKVINNAKICGKVESFNAGQNALLVITEKDKPENIVYINEAGLDENGDFEFLFSSSRSLADCDVTVYYEDASGKRAVAESRLKYSYTSADCTLDISGSEAVLTADVTNDSLNEINYILIIYMHDGDGFVQSVVASEPKTMKANEKISVDNVLTAPIPNGIEKVRGVVWSSFNEAIPISYVAEKTLGGGK